MPRNPRKYSETGLYHIMIRGNARENIFVDNQDKGKLLKIVFEKKKDNKFLLYAYCIMNNHAHFALKESTETVSNSMKKITTSYASYYNKKHNRVGHVFQDRFKSEVIENDPYLLSVIRYIHNNPEKAEIAKKDEYLWSSYQLYFSQNNKLPEIVDILNYFSTHIEESIEAFKNFSNKQENKKFMGFVENKAAEIQDPNKLLEIFLKNNKLEKCDLLKIENKMLTSNLIKELSMRCNLSTRNIADLTNLNREKVRKLLKSLSAEPSP